MEIVLHTILNYIHKYNVLKKRDAKIDFKAYFRYQFRVIPKGNLVYKKKK